jgi:hypothetical protein
MTSIEQHALERLARQLLGRADKIEVTTRRLARRGYDIEFLNEMISAYGSVPENFRRYRWRITENRVRIEAVRKPAMRIASRSADRDSYSLASAYAVGG